MSYGYEMGHPRTLFGHYKQTVQFLQQYIEIAKLKLDTNVSFLTASTIYLVRSNDRDRY